MTEPSPAAARRGRAQPVANPQLAAVLAWLLPGAGHFYLGRRSRRAAYLLLVTAVAAASAARSRATLDRRSPGSR